MDLARGEEADGGGAEALKRGTSDARCALHPERPAEATCRRCGRFCCAHCTVGGAAGEEVCRECNAREEAEDDVQGRSSRLAGATSLLGMLGVCLPPAAILAVLLGGLELVLIRSGYSPRGGRRLALFGFAIGAAALVVQVLVTLLGPFGRDF